MEFNEDSSVRAFGAPDQDGVEGTMRLSVQPSPIPFTYALLGPGEVVTEVDVFLLPDDPTLPLIRADGGTIDIQKGIPVKLSFDPSGHVVSQTPLSHQ